MPLLSALEMSLERLVRPQSRQGEITLMSGFRP